MGTRAKKAKPVETEQPKTTVTSADPSPAISAALAKIDAYFDAKSARDERIAGDTRIIWLTARKAELDAQFDHSAAGVFADMLSGRGVRASRIIRLIRARTAQLDRNGPSARRWLSDAAVCRRQSYERCPEAETVDMIVTRLRTEPDVDATAMRAVEGAVA